MCIRHYWEELDLVLKPTCSPVTMTSASSRTGLCSAQVLGLGWAYLGQGGAELMSAPASGPRPCCFPCPSSSGREVLFQMKKKSPNMQWNITVFNNSVFLLISLKFYWEITLKIFLKRWHGKSLIYHYFWNGFHSAFNYQRLWDELSARKELSLMENAGMKSDQIWFCFHLLESKMRQKEGQ